MTEYPKVNAFVAAFSFFVMALVAQTVLGPKSIWEKVFVVTIGLAMVAMVLIFEAWGIEREADRWK